jgi:hypothetical protein
MSPIDRVSLRSQALSTLGVTTSATRSDIRSAYKKLAFEKHPDRHPDSANEFSRITEAYRTICENEDEFNITDAPATERSARTRPVSRPVSRPTVTATETNFDEDTIAECKKALEDEDTEGTLHTATAIYRKGRYLTFYVPSQLGKGTNIVAVPTGMLHDTRRVMPKLLSFDHRDARGGHFDMPEDACAEHFPGARHVQIRFASA